MPTPGAAKLHLSLADHFLPHERNDHLPHVLRHHVLLSYSAIALLLKALLIVGATTLPAAVVFSSALTPENVVKLTNVARHAAGLADLKEDDRLAAAASEKAADIMEKQYFAHTSPEGVTPWQWIRGAGYEYHYAGENLALHYFTAEDAQEGWMASPTHRQNILDTRYADIGVGVQQGKYQGFDTVVVVEMFGTPKTAPVPQPANAPQPSVASQPVAAVADVPEVPEMPEAAEPQPVKVVPTATKGYAVSATLKDATAAKVVLGSESAPLTQAADGTWQGEITPAAPEPDLLPLTVIAVHPNGTETHAPAAMVVSGGSAPALYTGRADNPETVRFLGIFEVRGLEDAVRRFYAIGIAFLLLALCLKIFVRFHVQHRSVILHTLGVIALFAVLLKA